MRHRVLIRSRTNIKCDSDQKGCAALEPRTVGDDFTEFTSDGRAMRL